MVVEVKDRGEDPGVLQGAGEGWGQPQEEEEHPQAPRVTTYAPISEGEERHASRKGMINIATTQQSLTNFANAWEGGVWSMVMVRPSPGVQGFLMATCHKNGLIFSSHIKYLVHLMR